MRRALVLFTWVVLGACGDDAVPTDGSLVCSDDSQCDDGVFCNGAEVCAPERAGANALGCAAGEPACLAGQRCDETTDTCEALCEVETDADGDGVDAIACGGTDCDDSNPDVFPGATEICDAAGVDEDCDPGTWGTRDLDRDGFGPATCCNGDACGQDCDDTNAGAHPLATEACNGLDDDCDGDVDEGVSVAGFVDADGDGIGAAAAMGCAGVGGFALQGGDCADDDADVYPGLHDVVDGRDNDCDGALDEAPGGTVWYADTDMDGYGDPLGEARTSSTRPSPGAWTLNALDCDDGDGDVNPGALERCNGVDDDCDGTLDGGSATDREDDDGDGVADVTCGGTDCDDADPFAAPGAAERCNGRDDDCDGTVDEAVMETAFYVDADGDGYGAGAAVMSCDPGGFLVPRAGDCDDTDPRVFPGAREICDGVRQSCTASAIDSGAVCALPGGSARCEDGRCVVVRCPTGRADCDGLTINGCETDLLRDPASCAACGAACNTGGTCDLGICSTGRVVPGATLVGDVFPFWVDGAPSTSGVVVTHLNVDPPISATTDAAQRFSMDLPIPVTTGHSILIEHPTLLPTRYPLFDDVTFIIPLAVERSVVTALEAANPGMPTQQSSRGMVVVFEAHNDGAFDHTLAMGGTAETWRGVHDDASDTRVTFFFNVAPGPFQITRDPACQLIARDTLVQPGAASVVKLNCP